MARAFDDTGQVEQLFGDVARMGSYRLSLSEQGRLQWHTDAKDVPDPTPTHDPEVGAFKRMMYRLLGPLAPEEML